MGHIVCNCFLTLNLKFHIREHRLCLTSIDVNRVSGLGHDVKEVERGIN